MGQEFQEVRPLFVPCFTSEILPPDFETCGNMMYSSGRIRGLEPPRGETHRDSKGVRGDCKKVFFFMVTVGHGGGFLWKPFFGS